MVIDLTTLLGLGQISAQSQCSGCWTCPSPISVDTASNTAAATVTWLVGTHNHGQQRRCVQRDADAQLWQQVWHRPHPRRGLAGNSVQLPGHRNACVDAQQRPACTVVKWAMITERRTPRPMRPPMFLPTFLIRRLQFFQYTVAISRKLGVLVARTKI